MKLNFSESTTKLQNILLYFDEIFELRDVTRQEL